jgi:hypothetical protein
MSDWIIVTIATFSGNREPVHVRRSAIVSYGKRGFGHFIQIGSEIVLVHETEAELTALIADDRLYALEVSR